MVLEKLHKALQRKEASRWVLEHEEGFQRCRRPRRAIKVKKNSLNEEVFVCLDFSELGQPCGRNTWCLGQTVGEGFWIPDGSSINLRQTM